MTTGELSSHAEPRLLWVLSVPRALEERLIDWLLEQALAEPFSTAAIDLHGVSPEALRGAEKVGGRQRRIQFQVKVPASRLDELTATLHQELAGQDVDWFAVPIVAAASADSNPPA